MTARAWPRPDPEFTGPFGASRVLPELRGKTLGDLVARRAGVRLWCPACGRDVRITPKGLAERFPLLQACSVKAFVEAARCGTCGAKEAQGTGWSPEPRDAETCILLVREHARGPRVNRPLGNML
jgi:hypothetical protein